MKDITSLVEAKERTEGRNRIVQQARVCVIMSNFSFSKLLLIFDCITQTISFLM